MLFIIELVPPSRLSDFTRYTQKICHLLSSCRTFSIASKPSPDISGFEKGINLVRMLRDSGFEELDIILHVTCRDLNRENIKAKLQELRQLKIEKVLVVTGDDYKQGEVGSGCYESSLELLADVVAHSRSWFKWIAVGGYPGGNGRQSHDNVGECERLASRIKLGANAVITQCVFDSGCYNEFNKMMQERHHGIELIPSVALFSNLYEFDKVISLTRVNDLGSANLSEHLKSLEDSKTEECCREFSTKLCRDLTAPYSIILCTFGRLNLAQSLIQEFDPFSRTSKSSGNEFPS